LLHLHVLDCILVFIARSEAALINWCHSYYCIFLQFRNHVLNITL